MINDDPGADSVDRLTAEGVGKPHIQRLAESIVDHLRPRALGSPGARPGFSDRRAEIDDLPKVIRSADGPFQAVTRSAGSDHITFSFVPPGMNGALLGLPVGGALMLVSTARGATSVRVRR